MVIASYLLDKAREKGYAEGYPEGYAEGYPEGYSKGYAQGYAKGYAEGYAQERAEAYKDVNEQLDPYYKRMLEVRERGEDFDEPPPKIIRRR